jgi:hypothetical protein
MESIEFLLELFGGLVLLIGFGCLIGHFLKLNNFSDDRQKSKDFHLKKTDVVIKESGD